MSIGLGFALGGTIRRNETQKTQWPDAEFPTQSE